MAKVFIKARVTYPGIFITTLTTQAAIRARGGGRSLTTGVDVANPNVAYVIVDWESTASATRFWNSGEARVVMNEWKTIGPPEVVVLQESPIDGEL
jgi:hypothetical protein